MDEIFFNIHAQTERGSEIFRCTGNNTELYIHAPQFKEVDHLFHRYDTQDRRLGGFVFRHILGEEEFEKIKKYMFDTGEYQITYRPEPTESDFEQYLHTQSLDVDTWEG